jgi:hypothetical protein
MLFPMKQIRIDWLVELYVAGASLAAIAAAAQQECGISISCGASGRG